MWTTGRDSITNGPGIAKRYRIAIGVLSRILAGIRTENTSNGIVSKPSNDANLTGFSTNCLHYPAHANLGGRRSWEDVERLGYIRLG